MEVIGAFEYALGIYAVTLVVTLLVGLVIVVIRWASGERGHSRQAQGKTR